MKVWQSIKTWLAVALAAIGGFLIFLLKLRSDEAEKAKREAVEAHRRLVESEAELSRISEANRRRREMLEKDRIAQGTYNAKVEANRREADGKREEAAKATTDAEILDQANKLFP